ncbi:MAG: glutamate--tRNA ligase [Rhodospirillaceae bacterium]|nr:glutamate--tRNA ligase [Rhodospirillaceae bacterium]MBT5938777.1 glutamate--tRNA ligase [Rhodospirillaceae bacterium]
MPKVVTRFAPSPTGFLHIGGARTALFNWLYAKHHGGEFLLRIEDTDRKRSTDEAVAAIYGGMKWLGLDWDGDAYSQFERRDHHAEIARQLLADGKAYHCYCSPDELTEMRESARAAGSTRLYDGTWRDRDPADAPAGIDPVVRLKATLDGLTSISDAIQGEVTVNNDQMDDMILLRADGTPTYMLAVVVDDHDMGITHVVRGDDHLTNTFRQIQIYHALDWEIPIFAHMPLLHGSDGAKLSKRHGALGVEAYRDMGFLPEALNNYLLRLGWSHGDDEIISQEQAIEWFDLAAVGKGAARFDLDKLSSLNSHYINQADNERLVELILPEVSKLLDGNLSEEAESRLEQGMESLKDRAKNILELAENAVFYAAKRPIKITPKAAKNLDQNGLDMLAKIRTELAKIEIWEQDSIDQIARDVAEKEEVGLGKIAQPLRSALSGSHASPGIFEVMEVLGKEEALARLDDVFL